MLYVFLAYILRLGVGEIRWLPHPERGIEWLITELKDFFKLRFRNLKAAGILLAFLVIGITYAFARFFIWDLSLIYPALKGLGSIILIYLALSMKGIKEECLAYQIDREIMDSDREQLISRNIESVSENTVSGVIAVLIYAFIAGGILVWIYKAINILYLKTGHRNALDETGWFSTRLNETFNYLPSMISILLISFASYLTSRKDFLKTLKASYKEGVNHLQPYVGVAQASFANALCVQLGGLNYSQGLPVHTPYVGCLDNPPMDKHIEEAVRLMYVSSAITVGFLIIINYIWNVL